VNYKIEFDPKARKNLKSLDNSVRKQIKKFLDKLEKVENPKAFGKSLENNLSGLWRYRVGDYRIIAEIQDNRLIIYVVSVGHRSTIYKETDKRFKDRNL